MPENKRHKDVSNEQLLEFIQEHVAERLDKLPTHSDIDEIKKTLNDHTTEIKGIKHTLDGHTTALDGIAKDVSSLKDEKHATNKRISRVEYRTEKILGKKVNRVDSDFEEQYQGETRRAEAA